MPKIDSVSWGKVKIDGKDYWQVLIVDGKVIPREVEKVKEKYGTDHAIADREQELLLSGNPEVILIANGWSGLLKVSQKFNLACRQAGVKSQKLGIELRVVLTPKIVEEYNFLVQAGKRVNCLIHTTC